MGTALFCSLLCHGEGNGGGMAQAPCRQEHSGPMLATGCQLKTPACSLGQSQHLNLCGEEGVQACPHGQEELSSK